MDEGDSNNGGWMDSLRRSGHSLLGLTQSRLELFAVELQEEKLRALNLLVVLAIALALGVVGMLVLVGILGIYLWSVAGYFGLAGLAVVFLAASAGLLWSIRRGIRVGPTPFAETISEFRKDRECFRRDS
jgi:uncharacterized membrane protein YqjE